MKDTLRTLHPNLHFAVIVFGLWGYVTSVNFFTGNLPVEVGSVRYAIAMAYVIFATSKFAGLVNIKYIMVSRMGMLGCMVLSSLIFVMYLAYAVGTNLNVLQGAFNFLALGVLQLSAMSEPAVNPLTMKREKEDG